MSKTYCPQIEKNGNRKTNQSSITLKLVESMNCALNKILSYIKNSYVKFIYSEKATKFCETFPLLLTVCTVVKSKVKISQNFVAFSEYMNFKNVDFFTCITTIICTYARNIALYR